MRRQRERSTIEVPHETRFSLRPCWQRLAIPSTRSLRCRGVSDGRIIGACIRSKPIRHSRVGQFGNGCTGFRVARRQVYHTNGVGTSRVQRGPAYTTAMAFGDAFGCSWVQRALPSVPHPNGSHSASRCFSACRKRVLAGKSSVKREVRQGPRCCWIAGSCSSNKECQAGGEE